MPEIETIFINTIKDRYFEKPDKETALKDAITYSEIQIDPYATIDIDEFNSRTGQWRVSRFKEAELEALGGDTNKLSKLILEDGTSLVTKELSTERETQIGWALVNLASSIRRPR